MDSAWPLLLFLFGLMGSGVLILVCGIQSREEELRNGAESGSTSDATTALSFWETLEARLEGSREAEELAFLRSVEQKVRRQTELVAHFVECPSVNNLHDDGEERPEPSLFCRIQKYLELERQLVGEFVSDPTLDRLHGYRAVAV